MQGDAFCVGVFTPLAVGIPILVAVHAGSVHASFTPPDKSDEAKIFFSPLIPTEKDQPAGAAITGVFRSRAGAVDV